MEPKGELKLNNLAENLKELRKERKEKQREIAEKLNLSQDQYAKYERDEREPSLDVLIKLSDHFNITVDELIRRKA